MTGFRHAQQQGGCSGRSGDQVSKFPAPRGGAAEKPRAGERAGSQGLGAHPSRWPSPGVTPSLGEALRAPSLARLPGFLCPGGRRPYRFRREKGSCPRSHHQPRGSGRSHSQGVQLLPKWMEESQDSSLGTPPPSSSLKQSLHSRDCVRERMCEKAWVLHKKSLLALQSPH